MRGQSPTSKLTAKIEQEITQVKHNEHWRGEFMTLREHYEIERDEGREEGRAEGLVIGEAIGMAKAVDALASAQNISLAEACKTLGISVDEYNNAKANM